MNITTGKIEDFTYELEVALEGFKKLDGPGAFRGLLLATRERDNEGDKPATFQIHYLGGLDAPGAINICNMAISSAVELMPEGVSVNQDDAAMREYRHNRDKVALEAKIKELEAKNKELNRLYQKAVEGLPT